MELKNAVITVGHGRGFVIEVKGLRLVITAAHCLPSLPSGEQGSYSDERVYDDLLGDLNAPLPTVFAQPLFIDTVADIAVLGAPEHEELFEQTEDYDELLSNRPVLQIGKIKNKCDARVLTLDGRWVHCAVEPPNLDYCLGSLWITASSELIERGMSGSPILDDNSKAIGLISLGKGSNPRLTYALPAWLLKMMD